MVKRLFLFSVSALLVAGVANAGELEACQAQLAAKDAQISALNQALVNISGQKQSSGTLVVTTDRSYTCEAVCIHNMIGTGFRNPGELMRSNALTEGNTAAQAFQALLKKCDDDNKELLARANKAKAGRFAPESHVSSLMTKSELNSPDWHSKMVRSFQNEESVRKFCWKN